MTNGPTTGEIVSALRNCPNCDDCLRKDQKCYRNDHDAADRLESQEQTISALTARAESAERERDAAYQKGFEAGEEFERSLNEPD